MVLIYTNKNSPRLQYIAAFIFKELLKVPYAITSHPESFKDFDEIRINYSDEEFPGDELVIPNSGLLNEEGVSEKNIDVFEVSGFKAFFKSETPASPNLYPFDIFSACFYLISRYEEYLPQQKDKYGRYSHTNSLAYKENFLHLPVINTWVEHLAEVLKKQNKTFEIQQEPFQYKPTYDVDMAYSYLNKGGYRNSGGIVRSLFSLKFKDVAQRIRVLFAKGKDPFDNFEWMEELHKKYNSDPVYFFLMAEKNSQYDKNISPKNEAMQSLIKTIAEKYSVGLHPSWQSGDDVEILKKEKQTLEEISGKPIQKSRQHYIRFNLPTGYRRLIDAGLTNDYSMGYTTINGFRASVARSFFWFDLEKNEQTSLRVYPFCYMDSTSIFNEKLSAEDAYSEMLHYYNVCTQVNGTFISIMHNHLLGEDRKEWRDVYERFLQQV